MTPKPNGDGEPSQETCTEPTPDVRVVSLAERAADRELRAVTIPERLFATHHYRISDNSVWWDPSPIDGRFRMFRRPQLYESPVIVMAENLFTKLRAKLRP